MKKKQSVFVELLVFVCIRPYFLPTKERRLDCIMKKLSWERIHLNNIDILPEERQNGSK